MDRIITSLIMEVFSTIAAQRLCLAGLGILPMSLWSRTSPEATFICSANWMGRLADRRSRRGVLLLAMAIMAAGGLLTLSDLLPPVLAGAAAVVFGFFGAHSV